MSQTGSFVMAATLRLDEALGLALGLVGALAATGLVQSLLYGVEPTDPVSMIAGVAVLVVAALLAAYLPARRATMVDPVSALRRER